MLTLFRKEGVGPKVIAEFDWKDGNGTSTLVLAYRALIVCRASVRIVCKVVQVKSGFVKYRSELRKTRRNY